MKETPELLSESLVAALFEGRFSYTQSTRIEFTTHVPPLAHQSMRIAASGRTYKPKNVKDYQKAIQYEARLTLQKWRLSKHEPLLWPKLAIYRMAIRAYFADRRRRDVDNVAKPISDALNGVLWADDSLVQVLDVAKFVDRKDPRVHVLVEVIS